MPRMPTVVNGGPRVVQPRYPPNQQARVADSNVPKQAPVTNCDTPHTVTKSIEKIKFPYQRYGNSGKAEKGSGISPTSEARRETVRMLTPFPPDIQAGLDDFKLLNDFTNDIINVIDDYIKDYNANNNSNRLEKIGDVMIAYSVKMTERDAAEAFAACKPPFDNLGKYYRVFNASAQEYVLKPLRQLKEENKAISAVVKDLTKAKETMDKAIAQVRSKPDDAEAESAKTAAETAYNAYVEGTKPQLAKVEGMFDTFSDAVKTFDLLIVQLVVDEKAEYEKMLAANKY
uniref:BAR domain-containing protein n=1 Tax=Panagrellus redivivus TaxID=6233 RepID=A0A7E4UUF3_PANRE